MVRGDGRFAWAVRVGGSRWMWEVYSVKVKGDADELAAGIV